jgi:hypothetical protein
MDGDTPQEARKQQKVGLGLLVGDAVELGWLHYWLFISIVWVGIL